MTNRVLSLLAVALVAAGSSVSANAGESTVLNLGKTLEITQGISPSNVEIQDVEAHVIATSETSTLSLSGCYESKQSTGEGAPYGTRYVAFTASDSVRAAPKKAALIELRDLNSAQSAVTARVKGQVRFYCKTAESLLLILTVRNRKTGETGKVSISANKDSEGYFVDSFAGKIRL